MSETSVKEAPSATEIASYLRRHPEFLSEYPDIALTLAVPRDQGSTTSLASYQLDVLRDKNHELSRRLRELIEIAHENEQLMVRVHMLTVALMRERSLYDSARRVVAGLTEDFHTDLVRLVLFRAPGADLPAALGEDFHSSLVRVVLFRAADADLAAAEWLILAPGGVAELPAFAEFLKRGEPLCGRLQAEKLKFLFGAHAAEVRSSVLVPIDGTGMLAIGSGDTNRFHPGMGTLFVRLIAEAIGAAVTRFGQA
jgi:uncharacterized protein YigA (DUF484 family)